MPSAACGTCKDRRLRCDRKLPSCSNCARANRPCAGYGLRLSWPKKLDRKRSVIGPAPRAGSHPRAKYASSSRWINAGFQDIYSYLYLSKLQHGGTEAPLSIPPRLSWTPTKLHVPHTTLVEYFQIIASKVVGCDDRYQNLVGIVTRLAFGDDSVSSQAVLLAVLAVSSLFRYGLNTETIRLQGAAIRALQISIKGGITSSKVVQHMATNMLLCSFEIHGDSQTSGPWFWYVSGAKELIKAVDLRKDIISSEFIQTASWVYHHDVIAQFSLRHWRRKAHLRNKKIAQNHASPVTGNTTQSLTSIAKNMFEMTEISMPNHIILWSLAEVFQNIVDDSDPQYYNTQYRKDMVSIERTLESILNGSQVCESARLNFDEIESLQDRELAVLELHRLSALTYLERASKNFSGTCTKLSGWADAAFRIIKSMRYCRQVFPLFIFACEARTDEQRIIILDCIQDSTEVAPSGGLHMAKGMIQRAWNLEDLEPGGGINYMAKLDAIISIHETMPSFA